MVYANHALYALPSLAASRFRFSSSSPPPRLDSFSLHPPIQSSNPATTEPTGYRHYLPQIALCIKRVQLIGNALRENHPKRTKNHCEEASLDQAL